MAKDNSEQGNITAIPPVTWQSPAHYFVGVDLGQAQDPTAICILEAREEVRMPEDPCCYVYDVRHLMRFPLGMSYPAMAKNIGLMLTREPLRNNPTELIIDETGVGRAVGDIFNEHGLKPIKVTITAGIEENQNGPMRFTVPKQLLISNLDALLHTADDKQQTEGLRIAKDLPEAAALETELKEFRRYVSEAGRSTYGARDGQHDDLVLAVAIALWRAVRRKKTFSRDQRTPPRVLLGYPEFKRRPS